jgi:hypothetical protein
VLGWMVNNIVRIAEVIRITPGLVPMFCGGAARGAKC